MKRREFSEEEIDFVRRYADALSTRELAEAFTVRFGSPIGQTMIRRLMERNGIQSSVDRKNHPLPIGTERWSDYYQCVIVKVRSVSVVGIKDKRERDRLRNSQWMLKQNWVWEQTHGQPLPKDQVVVFLDGDRTNYAPENLHAERLNVIGTIEKMRMHSENAEIYRTALIWGELYYAMK